MVCFRRDNTLNVEDDLTVVLFNVTVNHQIPSNSVDRLGVEIRELHFLQQWVLISLGCYFI